MPMFLVRYIKVLLVIYGLLNFEFAKTNEIKFRNISTRDGLSHNIVTQILKDYKGFIWIATNGSLNKYDGNRFTIYEKIYNDSTSLSNNIINCLFEDKDKQLWIGTSDGLNRYNRESENFTKFYFDSKIPGSLSNNQVSAIYQDREGYLWIGTVGGGLNLYNPETKTFTRYKHDASNIYSISHDIVTAITEDKLGNLWVATIRGLNLLTDKRKGIFTCYSNNSESVFNYDRYITSIARDKWGTIWLGTRDNGVYILKTGSKGYEFNHLEHASNSDIKLGNLNILSFMGEDSLMWIGTENSGLFIYNIFTGKIKNYRYDPAIDYTLSNNSIWCIYKTDDNIVWLGIYNKGIDFYDPNYSRFNGFQTQKDGKGLSSNNVTGFAEDKTGNLWISTDGGGLDYWNRKNNIYTHYTSENGSLPVDAVMCVIVDSHNGVWCGTWSGGLNYKKEGGSFKRFPSLNKNGYLHSDNIISLTEDKKGRIWVGTIGSGIYCYYPETQKFVQVYGNYNELQFTNIWGQLHANDGTVWTCTSTGVFVIQELTNGDFDIKRYTHSKNDPTSLSDNQSRCILQDKQGNIWIGTDGSGLNKFEPKTETFIKWTKSDGLPDNSIKALKCDDEGFIWITTNKGMCRFSPAENVFKKYDSKDGLFSDLLSLNALYKTSQNEFFVGSYNGFNFFKPNEIQINKKKPHVYIVGLKINNENIIPGKNPALPRSILETSKIVLNYRQNVFTLEFASLNYSHPDKNQYSYMLEGFDEKWNNSGNSHTATYTNLQPGNYKFYVRGSNNHGVWSDEIATLEIEVLPPYWKSKLALALYLIVLLGLLYAFIVYKIQRSRERDRIKLERIKMEHEEELYKNKLDFLTHISHELRTPLSLMVSPLEQVINGERFSDSAREKLKLIYRNTNRLYRLVDELMDFSKMEHMKLNLNPVSSNIVQYINNLKGYFDELAQDRNINYTFDYATDPVFVSFDREKLDKVFFNLLQNAFKFTPDKGSIRIKLEVFTKDSEIWNKQVLELPEFAKNPASFVGVYVTDSGVGIPVEEQSRIFESFYQVQQRTNNASGTGIGLALANAIVSLHGGKIILNSKTGEGSEFKVFLPIEQIVNIETVVEDDNQSTLKSQFYIDKTSGIQHDEVVSTDEGTSKKYSVVLVEDNKELRKYVKDELSAHFKITEASGGNTAYEIILNKQPDIVISDIIMPDGDGLELCTRIKNNDRINHIPVILLTARNTSTDKLAGIERGADAYITKPFNIEILKAQINQLLTNRRRLFSKFTGSQLISYNSSVNTVEQQFMEALNKFVTEKISDPDLSVEYLADKLNLSRSQIYRKVKALTNLSPNDYVKIMRMEMARSLLENQPYTILEVSVKVGFTSASYFSKCFKETFGKLPTDVVAKKKIDSKQM